MLVLHKLDPNTNGAYILTAGKCTTTYNKHIHNMQNIWSWVQYIFIEIILLLSLCYTIYTALAIIIIIS